MAPAASPSILSATSAAAASKRPPASDAEPEPPLDSSSFSVPPIHQGDDGAARKGQQPKQQLGCPRCQSTNTKFCYYNNYSMAQPRHFCRACRRYWTHGGTLRDVPVGGASRRGGGGGGKRRRVEPASSPPTEAAAAPGLAAEDACLPGLSAFPFLSDGSFLPHFDFDLGAAPAAFSSWHSVVPSFYDGLAPWDDGTAGAAAWGDIASGLDLGWTPPGN
ncbi:hypothetical protein BS78_06G284500 [Paspalum vaginatum]|nr:hypothetical protein BS78_06G284500 [Paspalum vaginatum]